MPKEIKKSLKPIPLSLRGKKRYIEFELITESSLKEKDVSQAVWQSLLQNFGEFGTAKQKPWLISFNSKTSKGIIRCAHDKVDEVKTGLLFVKKVKNVKVVPKIIRVSGSVKKLK
jgi:ribonuclease P/MRP protein subunit POP5